MYHRITPENVLSLSKLYKISLSDEEVAEIADAALSATSNNRRYCQVLESFITGFVAEHAVAIAVDGKRNTKAFNVSDPNSYYYDVVDKNGMKYEVKTMTCHPKRNFISWKNNNYKTFMQYHRHIDFIIHASVNEISSNDFIVTIIAVNDATLFVDCSVNSGTSGDMSYFNHYAASEIESSSVLLRNLKTGEL